MRRQTGDGVHPTVDESRSVVITGASRGLGLAAAAHLYRQGWTVVAAMRSLEAGLDRLRSVTGVASDDPRLVGIRLDVDDPASIAAAAREILETVGAPDGLVHNAGVAGVGCVEEMPAAVYEQIFSTNFFGPVRLTQELLPCDACGWPWSDRRGVERGWVAGNAGHQRLLGRQGRPRTVGGVAVSGDRSVRSRGHGARRRERSRPTSSSSPRPTPTRTVPTPSCTQRSCAPATTSGVFAAPPARFARGARPGAG